MIVLEAVNLVWLSGAADQCAHGAVRLSVGDELLVSPEDGELTVTAAGLLLLRTLEANYEPDDELADHIQLLPHCGFFVYPDGDRCSISGCPEGVDLTVVTNGDNVTLRRGEVTAVTTRAQWRDAVISFVRQIEAFHERSPSREAVADPFEREGWQMFWQEWHRSVRATDDRAIGRVGDDAP